MLLKNKKTGAIYSIEDIDLGMAKYNSLAELNEKWEDYGETKEYWFINDLDEKPMKCVLRCCPVRDFAEWREKRKQIGNYFETKEEAEKVVEKLKAWKRLKDKGVSFEVKVIDRKWYLEPKAESPQRSFDEAQDLFKDVMIVFGDEE